MTTILNRRTERGVIQAMTLIDNLAENSKDFGELEEKAMTNDFLLSVMSSSVIRIAIQRYATMDID